MLRCISPYRAQVHGVSSIPTGDVYEGQWASVPCTGRGLEGQYTTYREGVGKYQWAGGDVYDGQWQQDKRHGEGGRENRQEAKKKKHTPKPNTAGLFP